MIDASTANDIFASISASWLVPFLIGIIVGMYLHPRFNKRG